MPNALKKGTDMSDVEKIAFADACLLGGFDPDHLRNVTNPEPGDMCGDGIYAVMAWLEDFRPVDQEEEGGEEQCESSDRLQDLEEMEKETFGHPFHPTNRIARILGADDNYTPPGWLNG